MRHQPSKDEPNHLVFWGDLPASFVGIWGAALEKRQTAEAMHKLKPDRWGPTDYVFDVPVDVAAGITGFWHYRPTEDAYRDVTTLEPINGISLQRLSKPLKWWQTARSIKYYNEGEERREPDMEELKQIQKEFMEALKRAKVREQTVEPNYFPAWNQNARLTLPHS